jgi:hypothetical protein
MIRAMTDRVRSRLSRMREWLGTKTETTRGGVLLMIVGWVIIASASFVGVVQVNRLSDRQLRDINATVAALEYETLVREYATCVQAVEGRAALRETMNDHYDASRDQMIDLLNAVGEIGGPVVDQLVADQSATVEARRIEQRDALDERRPSMTLADDCPEPPDPRHIADGDD